MASNQGCRKRGGGGGQGSLTKHTSDPGSTFSLLLLSQDFLFFRMDAISPALSLCFDFGNILGLFSCDFNFLVGSEVL